MDIEVKSQWRDKRRPLRKVRVTGFGNIMGEPGVAYEISDPERNQQPWRDSSATSVEYFLDTYEPDLPARVVLEDQATELLAELIGKVEAHASAELIALRERIERVQTYMDGVISPSQITLNHIRRMLNGEQ